jgi:hypothetical protein
LDTTDLTAGKHTLTVTASDASADPAFESSDVTFTVDPGRTIFINSPTAGAVVNGTITISGWTKHSVGPGGPLSGRVAVMVDGTFVRNAITGVSRPDVCRLHQAATAELATSAPGARIAPISALCNCLILAVLRLGHTC